MSVSNRRCHIPTSSASTSHHFSSLCLDAFVPVASSNVAKYSNQHWACSHVAAPCGAFPQSKHARCWQAWHCTAPQRTSWAGAVEGAVAVAVKNDDVGCRARACGQPTVEEHHFNKGQWSTKWFLKYVWYLVWSCFVGKREVNRSVETKRLQPSWGHTDPMVHTVRALVFKLDSAWWDQHVLQKRCPQSICRVWLAMSEEATSS